MIGTRVGSRPLITPRRRRWARFIHTRSVPPPALGVFTAAEQRLCVRLGAFSTFRNWWARNGARGSGGWQARRDLLAGVFDKLHDQLADLEQRALTSSLVEPISRFEGRYTHDVNILEPKV